jgi:hypothetical protein
MLARLAPFAILLAACSDDAGWSRDELPPMARIALTVTASSPAPCMPWGYGGGVRVAGLDTETPTVVVVAGDDVCAWDGDALACTLTRGPAGSLRIDFDKATARMDIPGAPACFTEYAIASVVAI